jgi:uncharacterized protein YyaL (SSP411 family)
MGNEDKRYNRLIEEKSPYLLQHAENPVAWYPWGDEAFERAGQEDKPIFLSIGYSTCHWCHVMEEESFQDEEVARLMNETFISIKVDREERPDIDSYYMSVCQLLTGSGGWPLTIVMTPDKQPFFAATYIPKTDAYGRTGLLRLIPTLAEIWQSRRQEVYQSAEEIKKHVAEIQSQPAAEVPDSGLLEAAYKEFEQQFDGQHGGFGGAPKFPTPHNLVFLLQYWKRSGEEKALHMVEETLQKMRQGGIYDQVGGGFHRYATDPPWRVPHFEKMLYDQALLVTAYLAAYQATGKRAYAETVEETLAYVLRELKDGGGAFYSAQDADSEGVEGKFYLWREEEIEKILGQAEGAFFKSAFNIRQPEGNILYLSEPLAEIADKQGVSETILKSQLQRGLKKLFAYRKRRLHPFRDDKILADWNGLMIAALAQAARILEQPIYYRAAAEAAEFVFQNMTDEGGRIRHRWRAGEAAVDGFLDDYAGLIWGCLELYETGFDLRYLQRALALNRILMDHFWDPETGGFFFTAADAEDLPLRQKRVTDGAVPSGNSLMVMNLTRLSRLSGNPEPEKQARAIGKLFSRHLRQNPSAFGQLLQGLNFWQGPSYEIVIVGKPEAAETRNIVHFLHTAFLPNRVILFKDSRSSNGRLSEIAPYTSDQRPIKGRTTVYVCRNFSCSLPVNSLGELKNMIQ